MKKTVVFFEVLILFTYDFFLAVINVAAWIFRSNKGLHPVIVRFPTSIKNQKALWFFALIISLTPGSLVVDLSKDNSILYIHFFHAPDPDQMITDLKERFERRLLILFNERGAT